MDLYLGLVVDSRREDLTLLRGDRRIGIDEARHDTTHRLDTERERRDVEKKDILDLTRQDTTLDSGTDSDDFVRVNALRRSLTEDLLYDLLDSRDTRRATYEDYFVDIALRETSVTQSSFARSDTSLDEAVSQLLELCTSQRTYQVLGHTTHGHDVGEVDLRRGRAGELDLSLLSSFLQTLHSHRILTEVYTFISLELVSEPVDDHVVEVITTEVRITIGRAYFEDTITELEDRDIERTTTEVEDSDLHIAVALVKTVGERSCRRFIDDTTDVQTSDLTSFLRSLTLSVVEVGRYGDDGIRDLSTEVVLSRLLHLLQDDSRDFLRRVEAAVDIDTRRVVVTTHNLIRYAGDFVLHLFEGLTHEALDRVDRLRGVRDSLTLCGVTYLTFATIDEGDDRGSRALTFAVSDDDRFVPFEYGDTRVCSPEVNSNDLSHNILLSFILFLLLFYFPSFSCVLLRRVPACRLPHRGRHLVKGRHL